MFYYIFQYLDKLDVPGAGLFNFISFRAALAVITSLIISVVYGKKIIHFLQKKQIGETVRDLGLEGQYKKQGTPTMGGLMIIASIIIPTLLFAKLHNIYIILMLITTIWLGIIGFLDDYIKVFKKNKEGLKGRFKIVGQVGLGLIVGLTIIFSDGIVIRENPNLNSSEMVEITDGNNSLETMIQNDHKSTKTTIPFFKDNEFDYAKILWFLDGDYKWITYILFVLIVIFIVTAISNGANMTDGLDGLAAGTSAIIGSTLGIFAYVSGNIIFAEYLKLMYIPEIGELVIFASAFIGATIGFLWYNAFPAQVFMGDTGSLTIGGIIAVMAILVRKELILPVLCGIFIIENFTVMMQVGYFKFTKKKYGEGKRIFLMAPLHHHYQKKGIPEPKIVARFIITGIILAVISVITLKVR
jgi:phospho-N-acetylmuramoyl-pentapeptide-transferase